MTSSAASPAVPEFRLGQPRYDQSTFRGRLQHFFDIVDPRTLLTSEARLRESVELLRAFESGGGRKSDGVDDEDLWKAQKIKQVGAKWRGEHDPICIMHFSHAFMLPRLWDTFAASFFANLSRRRKVLEVIQLIWDPQTNVCHIAKEMWSWTGSVSVIRFKILDSKELQVEVKF